MARSFLGKVAYGAALGAASLGARRLYTPLVNSGSKALSTYVRRKYNAAVGKRSVGNKRRSTRSLTTQRDSFSVVNRQKNSRAFRRFRSKVHAALQLDQPRQIYSFLGNAQHSTVAPSQELSIGGTYFGDNNCTGSADLWNMFKDAYTLAAVADAEKYKLQLGSGGMKIQMRNTGSAEVYITLYFCRARKAQPSGSTPKVAWDAYFADMSNVGAVTSTDPAMTPYMNANWCRYWKIQRTQVFKIKAGETADTEFGKRYNRIVSGRQLQDQGVSPGQMMVMWFIRSPPASTTPVSGSAGLDVHSVFMSWQKSFSYREVNGGQSTDEIGQTP